MSSEKCSCLIVEFNIVANTVMVPYLFFKTPVKPLQIGVGIKRPYLTHFRFLAFAWNETIRPFGFIIRYIRPVVCMATQSVCSLHHACSPKRVHSAPPLLPQMTRLTDHPRVLQADPAVIPVLHAQPPDVPGQLQSFLSPFWCPCLSLTVRWRIIWICLNFGFIISSDLCCLKQSVSIRLIMLE